MAFYWFNARKCSAERNSFSVQIDQIYELIQTQMVKNSIVGIYLGFAPIYITVSVIRTIVHRWKGIGWKELGWNALDKWPYYISYCISGFVFQRSSNALTTKDLFYSLLIYASLTLAMKAILSQIDGDVVKIEVHSVDGEV